LLTFPSWLLENSFMPLVVLDRDGVINEDSDNFIRSVTDWRPIPGSLEAIARLSRAGYTIAIVSNQSGIARGFLDLEQLEAIHTLLRQQVTNLGGHIAGIFFCPHGPGEGCRCRKPATGMLETMAGELGISPRGAPFVGDRLADLQAAMAYGCQPLLVRTGQGEATLQSLQSGSIALAGWQAIPVCDDLAAAARLILADYPA
jgi:D-glycero-D-manno-heptose 1,7-bisphosphate phosphatase